MLEDPGNFFEIVGGNPQTEIFEELLKGKQFRMERIVSTGQTTPPGEWYDQPEPEWVILLTGSARLRFEDSTESPADMILEPGDYMNIPARCRHRVEWTDPNQPTIWLALHYVECE